MRHIRTLIIILLLATGCATQSQQAKTEGTAVGAGIGALLGGLIGKAAGGDTDDALRGAAIGALVGGLIGYGYAARVDSHRKELAGKENDLDARIKFARDVNRETEGYNRRLEAELDQVSAKIEKKQLTRQELAKEKRALTSDAREANKQLALAQKDLRDMKAFRRRQIEQGQRSEELDRQIAKMEENLTDMKKYTSALASLSQRI
jgi:hypothetical protein